MQLARDNQTRTSVELSEMKGPGSSTTSRSTSEHEAQEATHRLKPWKDLVATEALPISQSEIHGALGLIDRDTCVTGIVSAITAGARFRYWKEISQADVKSALVAAMLAHEGVNRMSTLKEANSYNLPTPEFLHSVIRDNQMDPDTKGLAVLIMLKQPIGTQGVELLKDLSNSPSKSKFLSEALIAASKRLNNAFKTE